MKKILMIASLLLLFLTGCGERKVGHEAGRGINGVEETIENIKYGETVDNTSAIAIKVKFTNNCKKPVKILGESFKPVDYALEVNNDKKIPVSISFDKMKDMTEVNKNNLNGKIIKGGQTVDGWITLSFDKKLENTLKNAKQIDLVLYMNNADNDNKVQYVSEPKDAELDYDYNITKELKELMK